MLYIWFRVKLSTRTVSVILMVLELYRSINCVSVCTVQIKCKIRSFRGSVIIQIQVPLKAIRSNDGKIALDTLDAIRWNFTSERLDVERNSDFTI